jgi:hypothetical protein
VTFKMATKKHFSKFFFEATIGSFFKDKRP